MAKNITRVKWEASGLPFGVSFDERDGTFSGAPEDVGTHVVPVKVTTNYGSDTKDVFLRVEKRTHPLYVIGANAEVRSEGAEADSNGWRICRIPEGERIINLSEGFIVKTEAGTYVCGNVDITNYPNSQNNFGFNYYNTPTLKEEYENLQQACNGNITTSYSRTSPYTRIIITGGYFHWLDDKQVLKGMYTDATHYQSTSSGDVTLIDEGYDEALGLRNGVQRVSMLQECTGEGYLTEENNSLLWCMRDKGSFQTGNYYLPEDVIVKKIIDVSYPLVVGASANPKAILTTDGRLYHVRGNPLTEIETGVDYVKNAWGYGAVFIQDNDNNLYVFGSFAGTTYSEFTQIGTFDIKKLLQAGNATVILTNSGKLYYAGQCASIPAMAEQTSNFIQIYPRYVFHDVNLESTDMAALIKYID